LDFVCPTQTCSPEFPKQSMKYPRIDPLSVIGVGLAIATWYLLSLLLGNNFPPLHQVLANATENLLDSAYLVGITLPEGGYWPHLVRTILNVVVGVAVGTAMGICTGTASARWAIADRIMDPISAILGILPIVAVAPFFLIWFGLAPWTQVALVAIYASTIVHLYTLRAIRNVNPRYIEYSYTLGANAFRTFAQVSLPAALPEIFGGIRTALSAAWGISAIAELLGAEYGVGRVIISLWGVYDNTGMLALLLLLGLIAVIVDMMLLGLREYLTRWSDAGSQV
jgi:ABC-type nitrate/sulfonate/bicarbonate transport system permease component